MKRLLALLCILCVAVSCEEVKLSSGDKEILPSSSGKFGEVLVVVDTLYENGKTGEVLKEIFFKSLAGLPQQEAHFRMSSVATNDFKSILKRSRNILKLSIGKGKKTAVNIEEDVWASDQFLVQITAGSDNAAAKVLEKNKVVIRNYFNEKEIDRLKKQYSKKPQKELMDELNSKLGVQLVIPPGFVRMGGDDTGFWLKKEKSIGQHQVLQGITVYTYPYETDSVFSLEHMIQKRNGFTEKYIQGSRENSFMAVYEDYPTNKQEINLNSLYAVEFRGLWNMKNDFMGGPFLHYTFVDEKNNMVINLDGFVFAPKFNKREYLRELEAVMKTIRVN